MFLNIAKITEDQYEKVFKKRLLDKNSIDFRETCNNYLPKCERIFDELKPFNKKKFRELFYEKDEEISQSLLLKEFILLNTTEPGSAPLLPPTTGIPSLSPQR